MLNSNKLLTILGLVLLLGCQQNVVGEQPEPDQASQAEMIVNSSKEQQLMPTELKDTNLTYTGTIHFFNLEGGFFGIITDKGEKLLPMNLEKQYQQDGAVIKFSGNYKKNVMTIQQWGKPFTIKDIKLLKKGKPKANPEI